MYLGVWDYGSSYLSSDCHNHMPLLFFSTVSSQTGCVDISQGSVFTVEGGVQTCFRCGDGASATWTLDSLQISSSDGTVTNGVLTIFDPATVVPSVSPSTQLFCIAGSQQYLVFLRLRGRLGSTKLCSSKVLSCTLVPRPSCIEKKLHRITVSNNTAKDLKMKLACV